MQKWATACRNHRFADLGICRSVCKKGCRGNARLCFNSSAFSTANVFYQRFNKAHLTIVMFSQKHRTESEGGKLNAFSWRTAKIFCHLTAFILSKKDFQAEPRDHPLFPFPPKSRSSRAPVPLPRDPFPPQLRKLRSSIRNAHRLWPHAANNAVFWRIIYIFRSPISAYQRLDKASY